MRMPYHSTVHVFRICLSAVQVFIRFSVYSGFLTHDRNLLPPCKNNGRMYYSGNSEEM